MHRVEYLLTEHQSAKTAEKLEKEYDQYRSFTVQIPHNEYEHYHDGMNKYNQALDKNVR
jgi:hypothetical protein